MPSGDGGDYLPFVYNVVAAVFLTGCSLYSCIFLTLMVAGFPNAGVSVGRLLDGGVPA